MYTFIACQSYVDSQTVPNANETEKKKREQETEREISEVCISDSKAA